MDVAVVPDRNKPRGRFIKEVCIKCHSERLRSDLRNILAQHDKRMKETKGEQDSN